MPLIDVRLIEGRPEEVIRDLIEAVTSSVETSLGVPRESIRVLVEEVPPERWSVGGKTIAERRDA